MRETLESAPVLDLLVLLAEQTWKEWAITTIAHYSYVGVFVLLVICGLGFPCPEEVALIGGGYAVYQAGLNDPSAGGPEDLALMCVVAMAGVLVGDTLIWLIGRFAGDRAHKIPFLGRHLSPDRMEKARLMFNNHGAKAVFFGRFLFGIRAVTFLVAGSMRVPLPLFLLMDGLAGLISVPTSIFLAWYFGAHLHTALEKVTHLNNAILVLVALIGVVIGVLIWRRSRRKGAEAAAAAEARESARLEAAVTTAVAAKSVEAGAAGEASPAPTSAAAGEAAPSAEVE